MNDHEQSEDSVEEPITTGTRPIAAFNGTDGLQVAVWKNKTDAGKEYYSVRLDRSYKDSEGEYHSTQYLREGEVGEAI
jgi:hypothetical protein